MAGKVCPSCKRTYNSFAVYCTRCGVKLEKEKNHCSEMKTQLCKDMVFDDEDIYCCYCGALTTFAVEKKNSGDIIPNAEY